MLYCRCVLRAVGFFLCLVNACCLGSSEPKQKNHGKYFSADSLLRKVVNKKFLREEHKRGCYPNFTDNPKLNDEMRSVMEPFLLPLDSPLKPILDKIFSSSKVIDSRKNLKKAGFSILFDQKISHIIVAQHPKVPKYLFKLYLNSECRRRKGRPEWKWLTTRCAVAEKIRQIIEKKELRHFSVPDKWLYPLPADRGTKKGHPVVLIVSKMDIVNRKKSCVAWKTKVTEGVLKELFYIMGHRGYGSGCLDKNVPYTTDGKFAFIDTEYDERNLPLKKMGGFFSKKMQRTWEGLRKDSSKN